MKTELPIAGMAVGTSPAISYEITQLSDLLLELQEEGASGVVWVRAEASTGARQTFQRVLILDRGLVAYAGQAVPSPEEFLIELSRYTSIAALETILKFAAKRTSICGVLQAMEGLKLLSWPDINAGVRRQASATLAELLETRGHVRCNSQVPPAFDLHSNAPGTEFAGSTVDALLLDIHLRRSQQHQAPEPEAKPAPVKATAPRAQRSPAPAPAFLDRRPIILSVDDSPVARGLIARILGKQYRVESCSSALEAMNVLNERGQDFSLLLLDLMLPDMDGTDLCRALRKIPRFQNLPIVVLTARNGAIARLKSRMTGANHYLAKPFKAAELVAVVTQYAVTARQTERDVLLAPVAAGASA